MEGLNNCLYIVYTTNNYTIDDSNLQIGGWVQHYPKYLQSIST